MHDPQVEGFRIAFQYFVSQCDEPPETNDHHEYSDEDNTFLL